MRGGGEMCDFKPISRCISITVRDRAYRLILITNKKSYTGSRLTPNSMTLDAKIGVFMNFLTILYCETPFKIELRRNQLRHGALHMRFFSIERRF